MATPSKKLLRMREQLMLEEDRRAGGAQREEAAKQALAQADSLSSHAARLRQMAAGMLRANAEAQAVAGQPGSQTGVPANQPTARRQPGLPQAGAAPRQALSGQPQAPAFYNKADRMRQWEMLQQDRMAGAGQPQAPAFYNKADRMRQWEMLQQDRMAGGNQQAAFPASSGGTAPLAYAPQNQLIQAMPPLTPAQQYAEKVVRYGLEGAAAGGGGNSFSFAGDRRNAQVDPQKSAKQAAYFNNGADGVSLPHTLPLGSYIASAGASDRGMPFAQNALNTMRLDNYYPKSRVVDNLLYTPQNVQGKSTYDPRVELLSFQVNDNASQTEEPSFLVSNSDEDETLSNEGVFHTPTQNNETFSRENIPEGIDPSHIIIADPSSIDLTKNAWNKSIVSEQELANGQAQMWIEGYEYPGDQTPRTEGKNLKVDCVGVARLVAMRLLNQQAYDQFNISTTVKGTYDNAKHKGLITSDTKLVNGMQLIRVCSHY